MSADSDTRTAESVMSAFGATPKSRRDDVRAALRAPRGGKRAGRARFQGAIKKVIQTNRFRSALGPPDRLPKDLGEAQRTQIRAAFARVDGWDFDLWAVSDAVAGDGKLAARVVAEEIILERRRVAATRSPDFCALLRAFFASVLDRYERVPYGAGKGCDMPNFKGSSLGRFPLVSADFWTGDHLSERSRSVGAFCGTRARG